MKDNSQVERAFLGAILYDGQRIYEAITLLQPQDLILTSHRQIYCAMVEMSKTGQPIDLITLMDKLQNDGALASIGGVTYLSSLTDGIPGELRAYSKLIVAHSRKRRLSAICELGVQMANDGDDLGTCMERLESGLLSIRSDESKPEATAVKHFAMEALNRMLVMRDSAGELIGYSTGIDQLDESTTGIRHGELWVLGALPGRGKTAFGIQMAANNAKRGNATVFFSLEMSRDQLFLRMLAAESSVPAAKVRNPKWLNESQVQCLMDSTGDIREWPLYVDDSASLTSEELTARAKLYIRRYGAKLIVVDYLRLVESPGRELRERVANAANALRQLAKQENVAVLALSQLRRPPNINDRPTMIDLKESGDVEAHAHCVLLLYQPVDNGEFTHDDEVIIGKQRNGPLGTIPVVFDTKSLKFLPREVRQ